jgi:putative phosphoesterase
MLLGVVSDTHGHVAYAREAVRMLESLAVETVLHCGDIGSPEIVPLFRAWPTHFVFGNVDYDVRPLRAAIEAAGQTCHERFGDFELAGVRIALLHSDDAAAFREATHSGRYGLVCYGHTHVAKQERRGGTLVLNPGALYRAPRHTIAIVDLPAVTAEIVTVGADA